MARPIGERNAGDLKSAHAASLIVVPRTPGPILLVDAPETAESTPARIAR
jgi:hypothetical protein